MVPDTDILVGFQDIGYHMIFDIKMEDKFTNNARFVASNYITDSSSHIT